MRAGLTGQPQNATAVTPEMRSGWQETAGKSAQDVCHASKCYYSGQEVWSTVLHQQD